MISRQLLIRTAAFVALLVLFTFALTIRVSIEQSVRIIFGGAFMIITPGLIWSFIVFPTIDNRGETSWILRIILAIGLSIALVGLTILLGYGLGFKIRTNAVIIETTLLHLVGLGILAFEHIKIKKRTA